MTYKYKHINLRERFLLFIKEHQLVDSDEIVLLAVSGGVDSVVMCHLFYDANIKFEIAHCNFCLRGVDSDADEALVASLAQKYDVNFHTKRFDTLAYTHDHHLSIQMAARDLRYAWFEELCQTYKLSKLATAHHVNDSLETLLFNLTKGTGITGLHGILPKQGRLIRPLLFANKEELQEYAKGYGLVWREDKSNTKDDYARNLIRNKVLPLLKLINPGLETTTISTIDRIQQVEALFNEQLTQLKDQLFYERDQISYIAIDKIEGKSWAPVVVWEMLKPFGFNFLQIKGLLGTTLQSGKTIYSNTHQLYVDRKEWMLVPRQDTVVPNTHITDADTSSVVLVSGELKIKVVPKMNYELVNDKYIAALDLEKLQFPLLIRPWQLGDYFYPLGMQKKKKLSDFLIDLKVPVLLKQQVCVLVSGNEVVWVIGYRIDDRFKITEATRKVYEVRLIDRDKNFS